MRYSYFAVPTEESLRRLQDIFTSSPVPVKWGTVAVRIAMDTAKNIQAPEGFEYKGRITWFGQRYNQDLLHAELLGVLECSELIGRHRQLSETVDNDYQPALVFQSPATPLAASNKFFINSVANTLCSKEEAFTFVERVLSS